MLRALALFIIVFPAHAAIAQGALNAEYSMTFARLPVGSLTFHASFAGDDYSIAATARAGGVMRMLVEGEISMNTRGAIKAERPVPATFSAKAQSGTVSEQVSMQIEDGAATQLMLDPPALGDLVVNEVNRQGIVDPLTAMLVPAEAPNNPLAVQACQRTLPIFDGRHRYDLTLAFKRTDYLSSEKGFGGPVLVCAVQYRAIAGHRAETPLVKFFSEAREMEVALAAALGSTMLAPVRFSVTGSWASLVIAATRFESSCPGADADVQLKR